MQGQSVCPSRSTFLTGLSHSLHEETRTSPPPPSLTPDVLSYSSIFIALITSSYCTWNVVFIRQFVFGNSEVFFTSVSAGLVVVYLPSSFMSFLFFLSFFTILSQILNTSLHFIILEIQCPHFSQVFIYRIKDAFFSFLQ